MKKILSVFMDFRLVAFLCIFSFLIPKSVRAAEAIDHKGHGRQTVLTVDSFGSHLKTNYKKIGGKTLEIHSGDSQAEGIWSNIDGVAIPKSVAIGDSGTKIWVGQTLNAERTQLFDTTGVGTPLWEYPYSNIDPYVAASKGAPIFAALADNKVYKWTSSSSTPDWEYAFPAGYLAFEDIVISRDGSTIAAAGISSPPGTVLVAIFDPTSNVPIWTFSHSDSAYPIARGLDISSDGSIILFSSNSTIYVLDRDTQTIRWSKSITCASDTSLSGDGSIIANGCFNFMVFQWNGSIYETLWTYNFNFPGSWIMGACDVSNDGSTVMVGAYKYSNYLDKKVIMFDKNSSTPLWEYSTSGSGVYQDVIKDVELSDDGSKGIMSAWGDQYHTNPEVAVFNRGSPTPVYSLKTPGSVYSIDISSNGQYATAGCKAVHANVQGMGGVVYSMLTVPSPDIRISPVALDFYSSDPSPNAADLEKNDTEEVSENYGNKYDAYNNRREIVDSKVLKKLEQGESHVNVIVFLKGHRNFEANVAANNKARIAAVQSNIRNQQNNVLNRIDHPQFQLRHQFENILGVCRA